MKQSTDFFLLEKNGIDILVKKFLEEHKVFGPTKPGHDSTFDEIKSPKELHLDYISTVLPPKKFFHPPTENLFSFELIENTEWTYKETLHDEKTVLIGVHPCDVHAILRLDRFFSEDFRDPYYLSRRENTIIVALNCIEPSEYCFCESMGTGPFLEMGYDLLLTDIGKKYLLETGTYDGKKLLDGLKLEKADKKDLYEKKKLLEQAKKKFKRHVNTDGLSALLDDDTHDWDIWTKLAENGYPGKSFPCLSCGSCSLVCPTCYCYDVYDVIDLSLKKGVRKRELDSCQLLEYAEVALGGNFRRDRRERIRHWLMCKFGMAAGGDKSGCVGCGRCIRICPSKIDITEVARIIRGE